MGAGRYPNYAGGDGLSRRDRHPGVSSGRSTIGTVVGTTPAEFQDIMTTNLLGPFLAVRGAANDLIRCAPASIILLASIVATSAMKERVAYCASKAGVLA